MAYHGTGSTRIGSIYPPARVHRASFAGSVVPREYPWERIITKEGRLGALRNDIAATDWAVAFFPKLFDQLNVSDVGSGGFDCFTIMRQTSWKDATTKVSMVLQSNRGITNL